MSTTLKTLLKPLAIIASLVIASSCTKLDEQVYSDLTTTNFYTTKDEVISAVLRPYTHSRAVFAAQSRENIWRLNELSADQLAWPQKGIHGYDDGKWIQLHYHTWTNMHATISDAWNLLFMGLGYCNSGVENLEAHEASEMGITEEEKSEYIAELKANRAFYYLQAIGTFGNVPIVTAVGTPEYPATNSRQEVFDFIESEMLSVIDALPEMSSANSGRFTKIAGYAMLADLYLNAEVWTGTARWNDCLTYCNKVLAGEGGSQHGTLALDNDLLTPFSTQNTETSNENILVLSYDYQSSSDRCNWASDFYHFAQKYIDGGDRNGNNGIVVIPSAYDAFDDHDLRKKEWMLIGTQYYYNDPTTPVKGTVEYAGEPLTFVKEIKLNKSGGTTSTMYTGEENSGARFNKYRGGVYGSDDFCNNDYVLYRLAEFYLMKAEVLMRQAGGTATTEAVELVNTVRKRAFTETDWATGNYSYTTSSLTMDELLAERGREFIFEGKRRIDLIRFGKFVTGTWWDHSATTNTNLQLFPIPFSQTSVNPNLVQNEGY
ncbi:RagB/SusD family nutrient uptake outer membrane protein [Olivibacter ginsenosidimutans]|uniref:RagB/SusD family nutrient uptake outer membrane protein n=1 Tax=Olivibacter ginsenosidimutans TaxID=1176537 RepID=A0ABP9C112_9SPHI